MHALDPASAALWRNAEAAFRSDPDQAQALCQQLLARAPTFWGAHWMLARIYQARRSLPPRGRACTRIGAMPDC
jgi:hypothetical protein